MRVYNQSRSRIIQIIFVAVFLVIILQLLHLQLFSSEYRLQAENNAIYRKVVYPDRGIIYDRKRRAILENTVMYDLVVTPSEIKGTDTTTLCDILGIDTAEFKKRILTCIIKNSRYKPSVFEPLLSPEKYARLNEDMYKFNGFVLQDRPVRSYPYHAAAQVLGYIGEIDSNFLRKHAGEGYEMGDYAGRAGLELTYEKILMGQRGVRRFIRDNHARIVGSYEKGIFDTAAIAGRNLYTSMDIEVQQLAEKLLTNKVGSVIALNPKTGSIIAMASGPTYDPNELTGAQRRKNFSRMFLDTAKPLYNRAIKGQYPPGSTFKPLGGLIALDEGIITTSYGYPCPGAYYGCSHTVKCTHAGGGHAANLRIALAHSCNSYFVQVYRMAVDNPVYGDPQKGYAKWKEYTNSFGYGRRLGVDLPSEDGGYIPDTNRYTKDYGNDHWGSCFNETLGIGQDRMLATPLQMANLMAIIANGGYYYTPHFVDSVENETIADTGFFNKYRLKHTTTHISPESYAAIQGGMQDVTVEGTAAGIKVPGINYAAKTGTAQNPHGKDHSIFVAYAPVEDPKIAVAVVVENAGFGATWAGPIASLVIEKYLNDTLAAGRDKEVARVAGANLLPDAIKHWYQVKDSIRAAKAAKLQLDTIPVIKLDNGLENRKITYDPEAEPNRRDTGDAPTPPVTVQKPSPAVIPNNNNNKRKPNNRR